ncbi:MAG TPA: hypothetical protein VFF40_13395 [Acidimicrobiia bacterium]|nr:hypothetical protein [Acidimicrobiia bacterium]
MAIAPDMDAPDDDRTRPTTEGLVVSIGLGLIAAVLALLVSRDRISVAQDSAIYLGIAHNLLHGHGLTSPLTLLFTDSFTPLATRTFHGSLPVTTLPPGYSLLVAAVGVFGVSLETAARIVGALSLGVATFLLARMSLRLTGGAWPVAIGVAVLFLGAGPLSEAGIVPGSWLLLSAFALSEVPFLAVALATLLALAALLRTGSRSFLVLTGLGIGAAILLRFLGIALLGTAVLLVAFDRSHPLRERLRQVVVLGVLGLGPTLVWLASMALVVGRGKASTPPRYHSLATMRLRSGLENVAHWLVPTNVADGLAIVILVVVIVAVAGMAVLLMRHDPPDFLAPVPPDEPLRDPLLRVLGVFAVISILALVGSHLVVNAAISFDVRFIAPLRAIAYVLLAVIVYRFLRRAHVGVAAVIVLGACIVVTLPFAGDAVRLVRDGAISGLSRPSPTIEAVRDLPEDAVIVTNVPEQVWLRADRSSIIVPVKFVPEADLRNDRYRADLAETKRLLEQPNTYLVMLGGLYQTGGLLATTEDLRQVVPLKPVAAYPDGAIYRAAPS